MSTAVVHSVVGLKITFKSFLTFKTTVAQSITFLLLLVALLFCKGVRYSLLLIRTDPVLQLFPGFFFSSFFLLFFCTVPLSVGNWLDSLLTRGKKTLLWSQSVVQEPWHRERRDDLMASNKSTNGLVLHSVLTQCFHEKIVTSCNSCAITFAYHSREY